MNTITASPLLPLPSELRDAIYEHALDDSGNIHISMTTTACGCGYASAQALFGAVLSF